MSKNEFICDCTVVHDDIVALVQSKLCSGAESEQLADFFKIFGDRTRMRILCALAIHTLCVCDIANLLSMTKSAVSHQLAVLRRANMVSSRREGKTVFYSLSDDHIHALLATGFDHIKEGE